MIEGCWYIVDGSVLRLIKKGVSNYVFLSVEGFRVKHSPHKSNIRFLFNPEDKETAKAIKERTLELLKQNGERV